MAGGSNHKRVRFRRDESGLDLTVWAFDRRVMFWGGKVGTPLRRADSAPIRIYLKRWQIEVCVNDDCYFAACIPLTRPSVLSAELHRVRESA